MSLLKKSRRYSVFYFLASLCLVTPLTAQTYSKEQLQELAVSYIYDQLDPATADDKQLNALSLDSRIPDRSCESAPSYTIPTEPPFSRQITVQIKCNDLNGWSQYVHVRMIELSPVVVASENLSRGEVIEAHHLSLIMKPKHFVRAQYLQDEELLIGSRSKRNIRSGYPVALNQICMVCKGDNVTIFAVIRGLKIKTSGLALEDGTLGEQVKVKNAKSGKVLNARVDGVESVQVII
ncbi:flagellar basal body P-ring formation chaperone FlgA [Pseudoalteromonas haloplanktis]|uniref:Flagella basal body P-ring formation protein FlgA n=1 Tax=Pseudoalteromonas haloplanktis TaxID=228 RepID=A0ABU1BHX7_PSEHA|nr:MULTISPECIES: flagellar basal body P-ring formation chaperone FlgA [Pseudoalteromonas]MDQ9094078.1 flagellar basal body P-ring formation chaperone FlgA [Pseudoalteromonas haloplanktis]TMN73731.1 flagella basal body P-ring formation protein FlgA [Pseudoalteromonas sp. S1727]BDF95044.1 flagella basal body P-ring formation protein FlgA [Pseudoalteromonas sp. KAN5]